MQDYPEDAGLTSEFGYRPYGLCCIVSSPAWRRPGIVPASRLLDRSCEVMRVGEIQSMRFPNLKALSLAVFSGPRGHRHRCLGLRVSGPAAPAAGGASL